MGDTFKVSDVGLLQPFKVYKADSGGITFVVVKEPENNWQITLVGKQCPHKILYEIKVSCTSPYIVLKKDGIQRKTLQHHPHYLFFTEKCTKFWLSWYNDTIQMGVMESSYHIKPFFVYKDTLTGQDPKQLIGFIRFPFHEDMDIVVMSHPVLLDPIRHKNIEVGQLRWAKMIGDKLPQDALIGGFEDEPIYIARATHGQSVCPGKYVPSKKKAFVPWGHTEHKKTDFEILCGFNALWVKCKDNLIPENVFKAGVSEVRGEDVYIGRAMINDHLVVGKVHMLYRTCYLPYKGKEVEKYTYEVLVRGDMPTHGITTNKKCIMNPLKALQPCI